MSSLLASEPAVTPAAFGAHLQEVPPPAAPSSSSRFSSCTIANAAAVPLYFHLLRHADRPDRLWGLAAWRELLLQVGHALVLSRLSHCQSLGLVIVVMATGNRSVCSLFSRH